MPVEVQPDEANGTISLTAIERAIAEHGPRRRWCCGPACSTAPVRPSTSMQSPAPHACRGAHRFRPAHSVGNLPLRLHDVAPDFAVWCHYKYLNSGPGAVAGAFVHERHHRDTTLPRFAGWWGHEEATRFQMAPQFTPAIGAEGWQLSNPPILGLAPLRASLDLFERAGMDALRSKSLALTGMLEALVRARLPQVLEIITPADPQRRGCQLSLRVIGGRERGRALFEHLRSIGVLGDWREPDVIRISPTPLYNRYRTCTTSSRKWKPGPAFEPDPPLLLDSSLIAHASRSLSIIGAGLAGSLLAILLSRRAGASPCTNAAAIRAWPTTSGRSINRRWPSVGATPCARPVWKTR